MRNSAHKKSELHKKHEHHEHNDTAEQTTENVVEFVARSRLIAKQSEEACHIAGNNNSPDFDVFEAKYGLCCFA
jgi:hypothetical protein